MAIMDELISAVSVVAPILGSILGTPLAGTAISLLAAHFGVKSKNLAEILAAVTQNPDSLRALEYKHKEAMIGLMTDLIAESEARMTSLWVSIIAMIGLFTCLGLVIWACMTL